MSQRDLETQQRVSLDRGKRLITTLVAIPAAIGGAAFLLITMTGHTPKTFLISFPGYAGLIVFAVLAYKAFRRVGTALGDLIDSTLNRR